MPISRSLRRLAGSAASVLALALLPATAAATPAQAAPPLVGTTACHLSSVYGLQCGPVTAVNLTISFPGGVIHGVFRYSACVSSRDNGIAVYGLPGGQQVGTVMGGAGGGGAGGGGFCHTYALPLP